MGRASISIAITSNFNSSGIDAAIRKAEQLAASAVHYQGQFGKAAVDMGASMGQAAARLVAMGKSVAQLGDRLTMGVTVPMGLAAAAAVTSAAKIDTAWYNVRKTVDMTEEGYQRLKQGAMDLAEVQPVSAETILNIEALGGQLGITNGYLEDFAKVVSGLDIATNLDSDTAASELAQFRNIVQMSESDLDNFASTVVDLGNHTATTEADMMNLAMRFASAGHIAGMSNADILGLSAALSGLGMKAEAGGSAISRTVNDINTAVSVGGEKLEKWANLVGKTPEQFTEAWRNAPTDEFIEVLTNIGNAGEDMGKVLDELGITQIRQSDAMRRLASSGDYVRETVERANQAWRENSALTREVENRNESLQARWDTFCNRMTNDLARIGQPLAEMGLSALEGLEPVISGVGDLTQAFADADPVVQQFAFNLAAVAMSAGPVLSIAGRLMQAFGNMGLRVGRVTQQWGVYQEAMKTTDISLLNTLSNNQSLAASFGASRNAIVKAAGGLDRYNIAYARTTDAIRKNVEQEVRQLAYQDAFNEAMAKGTKTEEECARVADRAAHSRETSADVTRKQKAAIKELNDSLDETNVATKLNTKAISDSDVAAAKASRTFGKMGDAIKGALIGFGASAAIGLAVAGITWLITSMQEAAEEADTFDKATNGLRDALNGVGESAETAGDQHRNFIASLRESHQQVLDATENQAKLADKFREVDASAASQVNAIDRAREAIEKYAYGGELNASEQYRLKAAIDQVNEACGTQYSVVDASKGIIADETGTILENKDAILQNIDARKRMIQLEALEQKYSEAYAQKLETQDAYTNAVTKYNQAVKRRNELEEKGLSYLNNSETEEYAQLTDNLANGFHGLVTQAEEDMKKAKGDLDAIDETVQRTERSIDNLSGATRELLEGFEAMIDPTSLWSSYFDAADQDIAEFAAACQTAGINWQFLSSLTETEIQHMAETFDGSTTSIIRSLEDLGKTDALTNLGNNWRGSIDEASQQLADGISNAHGIALAEIGALATDLGIEGEEAMHKFLTGLQSGLDAGLEVDQAAKLAQRIAQEFEEGLTPEQAAEIARNFIANLARGMGEAGALEQAIQQLKRSLSQVDFTTEGSNAAQTFFAGLSQGAAQYQSDSSLVWSDTGKVIGRVLSDGTVEGINEGAPNVGNATSSMLDYIWPLLTGGRERAYAEGEGTASDYGLGFETGSTGTASSAQGMVDNLIALLFGGVAGAQDAGSQTGQGYGDSVSGQGATAENAAAQTLGRLLMIWILGIESARQAGQRTGQAYGEGANAGFANANAAAQAAIQTLLALLQSGVAVATVAGLATGQGYAMSLSQNLVLAAMLTQTSVNAIVTALRAGIAPATEAGNQMGLGFSRALSESAYKAITVASSISRQTGSAFGAGRGAASSAGTALGSAFASAVWSAGGQAISYARSIRDSVASIFNNIPTANIKVNVQRTYSSGAARAALPSPVPVMPVPYTTAQRATVIADRAVSRIAATQSTSSNTMSVRRGISMAVTNQSAPIDYDAMYRVVRSGVKAAIQESGGLAPDIKLDGRSIVDHVDRELGRRQAMWG